MLLPNELDRDKLKWATVTDDSPLTIRLDGEVGTLLGIPDTLAAPLAVGNRVLVVLIINDDPRFKARRAIIVGKHGGTAPQTHTHTQFAYKAADESVNSSNTGTTLQNDNELFVTVPANVTRKLEMHVIQNSPTAADFKADFTFPAGLTMTYSRLGVGLASGGNVHQLFVSNQLTVILDDGLAADRSFMIWGRVTNGSTAGVLQFRWAQNTANASDTTVRAGSYMELT